MKFGLETLATEGEHDARIIAVQDLGIVKGQFRAEKKLTISFEILDQPDENGDSPVTHCWYAQKFSSASALGKLLDDMGYARDGKDFDMNCLCGQPLRVSIQHSRCGKFANVTHVIEEAKYKNRAKNRIPPICQGKYKGDDCFNEPDSYLEKFCNVCKYNPTPESPAVSMCCAEGDCTNSPESGSSFCYRHVGVTL